MNPVLGILTSDGRKPFGGNHYNFADLIRMGRKKNSDVVVVTLKSLKNPQKRISAYRLKNLRGKPEWEIVSVPVPPVIYNRLPHRNIEQLPQTKKILAQLQQSPDTQLFNPYFFDKWNLAQKMTQSPQLVHLIPETIPLRDYASMQKLLFQHGSLYAKPIHGKAGIGMMRLEKKRAGYELIYQHARGKKRIRSSSLQSIWKTVQKLQAGKDYILQQGIQLPTFQGRPYDIRVLVQKNGQGTWEVTGIGIRVAGKSAISTHVPMGGKIADCHSVFTQTFGTKKEAMEQKIRDIVLKIAKYIESTQSDLIGEMSMDLGGEANGNIWFFEANAKPMKFDEPRIRTRSLANLIDYAHYLRRHHVKEEAEISEHQEM